MRLITLVFWVLFLAIPLVAQTAVGSWTLGPNWTYNRNINNQELARIAMQGEINKRLLNSSKPAGKNMKRVQASGPTSFRQSENLMPGQIADKIKGTAAEKEALKLALGNSIRFYENIALAKGYPSNDLSFAMLYFVINNYVIYRNIDPAATDVGGKTQYLVGGFYSPIYSHEKAVFSQLRSQLQRSSELKSMKDEDKQKKTELLAIYTTLMWHRFQELARLRDMTGLGAIRDLAESNVEGFVGAEIEKIEIGKKGIVIRK